MGKYTSTLRQWLTPGAPEEGSDNITSRGVEWDARGVMKTCLFCEYAAQTKDKKLVYEDDDVVAFAPVRASAKQHLLVIPRRHISTVGDLIVSDAEILDRMRNVAERILKCHDASTTQFSFQIPPWNSIDHLHLHAFEKPFNHWWQSLRFTEGRPWCASFKSVREWVNGASFEEGQLPLSRVDES